MRTNMKQTTIHKLAARLPRRVVGLLAVFAVIAGVGGATALAYGPERQTFTIQKPATFVTFNAITNNPNYGDERNFSLIKDAANTTAGGWADEVTVQDGKEYLVRVYVHNNAAANLGLVAKNTRISSNVPTTTGTSVQIANNVIADNANPGKVWDEVVLKSDKRFNIAYVAGSARYFNNKFPAEGLALPDSIVTAAGAKVGYEKLDGNVPGCFEFSGIATYRVKVQTEKTPDFTVEKKVRVNGTTDWQKSVAVKPGQKIDYQIGYKNTGETWQNNVTVKDQLPKGVSYVKNSTTLKNASNSEGDGMKITSNDVTTSGINIGNYAAPANAFVRFSATAPAAKDLLCGENKLTNTGTVSTENGSKKDTADIIVTVECKPGECKPGIPEGDPRCAEPCVPKEGETVDKNGNCIPAELPTTGPAEIIAAIVGVTAISLGMAYWIRSRGAYKRALAGFSEDIDEPEVKLLTERTETKPEDDHKND